MITTDTLKEVLAKNDLVYVEPGLWRSPKWVASFADADAQAFQVVIIGAQAYDEYNALTREEKLSGTAGLAKYQEARVICRKIGEVRELFRKYEGLNDSVTYFTRILAEMPKNKFTKSELQGAKDDLTRFCEKHGVPQ